MELKIFFNIWSFFSDLYDCTVVQMWKSHVMCSVRLLQREKAEQRRETPASRNDANYWCPLAGQQPALYSAARRDVLFNERINSLRLALFSRVRCSSRVLLAIAIEKLCNALHSGHTSSTKHRRNEVFPTAFVIILLIGALAGAASNLSIQCLLVSRKNVMQKPKRGRIKAIIKDLVKSVQLIFKSLNQQDATEKIWKNKIS